MSLFGIFDLFKPGYYASHDGVGHVIRMEEFYNSFRDGEFPVRWSKRLYFGYGYPFFNFNYPGVYLAGLPVMLAGFSATEAMKAETIGAFIFSGVLMYLYLRRKVDQPFAYLGAILYLYAPYRMSNIYVRGSVAEAGAFVFPPLLLWAAEALVVRKKKAIFMTALIVGAMGISHNISALLLSGVFFGYLILLSVERKSGWVLIRGIISFLLGIGLSAFFLVPALYEKGWTFLDLTIARDYPNYFVSLRQLIDPGWGFGGAGIGPGSMSLNLGWVQMGLVVIGMATLFLGVRKKIREYAFGDYFLFGFCLLMVFVSVFFMIPVSKIIWDHLPLLPFVQFPWRFTLLAVPSFAVIGALTMQVIFNKRSGIIRWLVVILLTGLCLYLSSGQWHRNRTVYVKQYSGEAIPGSTTWADEQATRWLVPRPTKIPQNKIESDDPLFSFEVFKWKTQEHSYHIRANRPATISENTMYYPGWMVFVDGKKAGVDYQNSRFPGRLVYQVSAGEHLITSRLTETPLREAVDWLSLGTLWFIVLGILFPGDFFSHVITKVFTKH